MSKELDDIISRYVNGTIDAKSFAFEFERTFNFEVSGTARAPYQSLFDIVVRFSPFPDEVRAIPHYIDETAMRSAALKFQSESNPDA